MTLQWETVHDIETEGMAEYTERMKLPEGWLYRVSTYERESGRCTSTALTFVPDAAKED